MAPNAHPAPAAPGAPPADSPAVPPAAPTAPPAAASPPAPSTAAPATASPGATGPAPLHPRPLTAAAFAPYGTVLQVPADGAGGHAINAGTSQRFEVVADARLTAEGGRAVLSISRAQARVLPLDLVEMECHALGSQAFVPLGAPRRLVLVVAPPGPAPRGVQDLAAFVSDGRQGVLLAPGTWHHALLALDAGDFLVIERRAAAVDCLLAPLQPPVRLAMPVGDDL